MNKLFVSEEVNFITFIKDSRFCDCKLLVTESNENNYVEKYV